MEFNVVSGLFWAVGQVLKGLLGLVSPLVIGLILAYLLWPTVTFLEGKLKNRLLSIAIAYVLTTAALLGILYGFLVLILGSLPRGGVGEVLPQITQYFEDALAGLRSFAEEKLGISMESPDFAQLFADFDKAGVSEALVGELSLSSAAKILSSIADAVIDFFLGVVASVYLMKDKEYFLRLWQQLLSLVTKQKTHGLICETLSEIQSVMTTFLRATFMDSFIVAFLCAAALTVLQVRYAVVLGLLCGILNIIPYFGPFFSMVPAFVVAFFQEASTGAGLTRAVFAVLGVLVVQQLDSNYIYPKLVGTSVGLHPLFVLVSLSAMGYVGGVLGMVLAVPAAGVLQVLVRRWAESRR